MFLRFLFILCSQKHIVNHNLPICVNCKYFFPYENGKISMLHKCKKFGTKNIVTGKINYDFADLCRENTAKCGPTAVYFVPKNETL